MADAERGLPRTAWVVVRDAFGHFLWDDGWAMASHVALSALMALFPFLIFVASLAGFVGAEGLSVRVAEILFAVWPQDVAGPIADEVRRVLATEHRGLVTVSAVITVYLASNGIEAVRNGLNRAYRVVDRRSIFFRRGQSIVLVLVGAVASLALVLLAALGSSALNDLVAVAPLLKPIAYVSVLVRALIAGVLLVAALALAHVWLPAGRPHWLRLWPGIALTFAGWLIATWLFRIYLTTFSNMAATYAGLAGVFTAVFFLYTVAALLLFGAEFNAALSRLRDGTIGYEVRRGRTGVAAAARRAASRR
jgi:membrane protein